MTKQLLTHSRMQSFKSCRKRHWFEYEQGIRKEHDAKALRMGSAGHEGLDVLNKTCDVAQAVQAVRDYYGMCPDEFDEWEWTIERETMETLISAYHWRWSEQPIEMIASEQSFKVPLINPETNAASKLWNAAGKIDGIISMESRKLVLEHKFVSDPIEQDSDYWRRLQLDSQICLYTWAARQLGHNVTGVFYDLIRKPTIKPSQIPILDEDGKKIVLDADGERVFNKLKAKKKCEACGGEGVVEPESGSCELDIPYPCECTIGAPRQTGSTADGYVLQTRQMTPEEWSEKLLADIGERPEFYFQRIEIARLDDDINEMMSEMWDIQKTIRQAQNEDRWFKTVSKDTCTWCPFFGLCTSKFVPNGVAPEGFVILNDVNPEL